MKRCKICGAAADRESMCHHCRAALHRARDETVSRFQPRPALALAGAGAQRIPRPTATRRRTARALPVAPRATGAAAPAVAATASAGGSPFVWIIVTLMVLVGSYAVYGMFNEGLEARSRAAVPPEVVVAPPRSAPLGARVAGPRPAVSSPAPTPMPSAPEERPAAAVPVTPPVLARDAVRPVKSAETTRSASSESSLPSVRTPPKAAPTRPEVEVPAATSPVPKAYPLVSSSVRPPDVGRETRWERMAAAIQRCAGEGLFGRVLCEQKVRFEYCDGEWGRVAQCPGNTPSDQGQ